MLAGLVLWWGAGCTHPLIAGIITNHQVLWLPLPPPFPDLFLLGLHL